MNLPEPPDPTDNPHGLCGPDDGVVTAANYACDHCRSLRFADIATQLDKSDQAWLFGFLGYVCGLESFVEEVTDDDEDELDQKPLIVDPDDLPNKPEHDEHDEHD